MLSTIYSKALIFALLIIVVFSLACGSDSSSETKESTAAPDATKAVEKSSTSDGHSDEIAEAEKGIVKVLNQDMGGSGSYTFKPNEFIFEKGQNVTFEMTAETEYHTFTVDKLKIDEDINAGETKRFKFDFNETGTFELYCIVHKSSGMIGEIIVK